MSFVHPSRLAKAPAIAGSSTSAQSRDDRVSSRPLPPPGPPPNRPSTLHEDGERGAGSTSLPQDDLDRESSLRTQLLARRQQDDNRASREQNAHGDRDHGRIDERRQGGGAGYEGRSVLSGSWDRSDQDRGDAFQRYGYGDHRDRRGEGERGHDRSHRDEDRGNGRGRYWEQGRRNYDERGGRDNQGWERRPPPPRRDVAPDEYRGDGGGRGGAGWQRGPPRGGDTDPSFLNARAQQRIEAVAKPVWESSPRAPLSEEEAEAEEEERRRKKSKSKSSSKHKSRSSSHRHRSSSHRHHHKSSKSLRRRDHSSDDSEADSEEEERRRRKRRKREEEKRSSDRARSQSRSRSRSPMDEDRSDGEGDEAGRRRQKEERGKPRRADSDSDDDGERERRRRRRRRRSSASVSEGDRQEERNGGSGQHDLNGKGRDRDMSMEALEGVGAEENDDAEVGPQLPVDESGAPLDPRSYGGALRPGEGSAMAAYVASGQRIPRRGEIGLQSDQIEKYEAAGFVMSGSRHRRMNAVRMRKENQVISAEEQRAILKMRKEEKMKREGEIVSQFKELVDTMGPGQ